MRGENEGEECRGVSSKGNWETMGKMKEIGEARGGEGEAKRGSGNKKYKRI